MTYTRYAVIGAGLVCLVALLCLACAPSTRANASESHDDGASGARGPAVVELFTSEGCSSCPPADVLLADLHQRYEKAGKPVFFLAFHVDYWDHLGWKDAFGNPKFSARQQSYSEVLNGDGAYTPQMIVNGVDGFIGSDRGRATASIDHAVKKAPLAMLSIELAAVRADTINVDFKVTPRVAGAMVNVALVQREAASNVARGENRGRTLGHRNVVRAFEAVRQNDDGGGSVKLELPAGIDRKNLAVIAFVQQAGLKEIVAASEVALPEQVAKK